MSRRRVIAVTSAGVLALGALVCWSAGSASAGHGPTTDATLSPTVTQQSVVALPTPTTPAVDLPGYDKPTVQLGEMNTDEQFIVGALYQLALEHQGYKVVTNQLGPPAVRAAAMQQGTLNLYPGYLDQWNAQVAHLHRRYHSLSASDGAAREYASAHGYVLLKPSPGSDTSAIAVTTGYAAENHIHAIADLAHGPQIIVGVPLGLRTGSTGLDALSRAYRLDHPYAKTTLVGLEYQTLDAGNAQAAYVTSTDPQLAGPQYLMLRDPKRFFGFGNIVPVTTPKFLAREGPWLQRAIDQVDALLTTRALRGLNSEVAQQHRQVQIVAQQFLQGNGILPPTVFKPAGSPTPAG